MLLLLRATVFAAFLLSSASGHATVVSPRSRNSIDYLPDATPDGPVNSPKDWPSNKVILLSEIVSVWATVFTLTAGFLTR